MTRFLPLTRGGWPAEVLCEATVGVTPLCVKHMLPNGDVSVAMHRMNGWYYRDEESPHDLIPAPEPSEAAVKAALEVWRNSTSRPEDAFKAGICAAYAIDGITPQQQPDRVAELEAEVAKLTAERGQAREEVERLDAKLDRYRNWKPSNEAATVARRALYRENTDLWKKALLAAFRHDFPDAQPGTGEQA